MILLQHLPEGIAVLAVLVQAVADMAIFWEGRLMAEHERERLLVGGEVRFQPLAQRGHDVAVSGDVTAGPGLAIPVLVEHHEVGIGIIPGVSGFLGAGRAAMSDQLLQGGPRRIAILVFVVPPLHRGWGRAPPGVVIADDRVPDRLRAELGINHLAQGCGCLAHSIGQVAHGDLEDALAAGMGLHGLKQRGVSLGVVVQVTRHREVERVGSGVGSLGKLGCNREQGRNPKGQDLFDTETDREPTDIVEEGKGLQLRPFRLGRGVEHPRRIRTLYGERKNRCFSG